MCCRPVRGHVLVNRTPYRQIARYSQYRRLTDRLGAAGGNGHRDPRICEVGAGNSTVPAWNLSRRPRGGNRIGVGRCMDPPTLPEGDHKRPRMPRSRCPRTRQTAQPNRNPRRRPVELLPRRQRRMSSKYAGARSRYWRLILSPRSSPTWNGPYRSGTVEDGLNGLLSWHAQRATG